MSKKSASYKQIYSIENLMQAGHRTLLDGRRYKREGSFFKLYYEKHLLQIQKELQSKTYKPGKYRIFTIYEPKQRLVLAAPLKDRVVHHALHDVVEPLIDSKFIYDSYACRQNKGTHKAITRAQRFLQANAYFTHLDVKKYFLNIDHMIIKNILKKHFVDVAILDLFDVIIDSPLPKDQNVDLFNPVVTPKGLPIGNLTSQFLANLYLNELDQYVKHKLRCRYYLRYMDDFVVFGNDRNWLKQAQQSIIAFCDSKLQLALHLKGGIKNYSESLGFLGFKIYRKHKKIKGVSLNRFMRKYQAKKKLVALEVIDDKALQRSVDSWKNHSSFGDTYRLHYFLKNKYNLTMMEDAMRE